MARTPRNRSIPRNQRIPEPPAPLYGVRLGASAIPERTRPVNPGPACDATGAQTGPRKPVVSEELKRGVDTGLGSDGLGAAGAQRPFTPPRRSRQSPARPGGRG
jgi:hypothetical protein